MLFGDAFRFIALTAMTVYFTGGDTGVYAACVGTGMVASIAQSVIVRDERFLPFYLPMAWATAAAATYSVLV